MAVRAGVFIGPNRLKPPPNRLRNHDNPDIAFRSIEAARCGTVKITRKEVADIIDTCLERSRRIQALGAVSAQELENRGEKLPAGWWWADYDWALPPHVSPDDIDRKIQ